MEKINCHCWPPISPFRCQAFQLFIIKEFYLHLTLQWSSIWGTGFPIQGSQIQNRSVAPRLTQYNPWGLSSKNLTISSYWVFSIETLELHLQKWTIKVFFSKCHPTLKCVKNEVVIPLKTLFGFYQEVEIKWQWPDIAHKTRNHPILRLV